MKPLVSIITPVYNAEKTISYTIDSVISQTMTDFEMLIVDDMSDDKTISIIKEYQKKDKRIKLFQSNKKIGATGARNKALKEACGRYIAFLDADDLWTKDKLKKQVKYMQKNNYAFTYTDYEYIDNFNNKIGIMRKCPKKVSYFRMLLGDSIGCLTVMYDSKKVGKIEIPNIKKRNDYALWCQILKRVKVGYKYNEILALYRKSENSLSSGSKFGLLKYHYQLHRNINRFNLFTSLFLTTTNVLNYIINKVIRDQKKKIKVVGIIGHFGINKQFNDGQTVKTKNVYNELVKIYGESEVNIVDTYNWKKNPIKLFLNCFKLIKNSHNVVILTARNGVKVFIPLFNKFNLFYKRNLHYVLIGSWLYDLLKDNQKLIKSLKKYKGIYVENYTLINKLETLTLKNLIVMPNFKDIEPISEKEIKKVDLKEIKMCIFSRIMFEKGIEDAIDCVKRISNKYPDKKFTLDIYGPIDSNYQDRFVKICDKLPDNIQYFGVIESSESVRVIREYDILLFPTHFKTEGIPGTILDAYASGVLVIASKWENFQEIIDDNKTGIGFEILNNEDFYSKLENLINDSQKMEKLKLGALKKYQDYIPEKVIKKLTDRF